MALDYSVWREQEVGSTRMLYFWEVVDVMSDGCEVNMTGGIENSRDEALARAREAIRTKPWKKKQPN